MHPLATIWSPNPNPDGQWSIPAGLISAIIWFAAERRWFRNGRWNDWITALSPFVPLALILTARLWITSTDPRLVYGERPRSYWHAENHVAIYILIATALILSRKGVRLPARDLKLFGFAALAMSFGILAIEFLMMVERFTGF